MKGREVREALSSNADPRVVHCIASVAEEVSAISVELNAMAQLLNSMVDLTAGLTETMEQIKFVAEKRD